MTGQHGYGQARPAEAAGFRVVALTAIVALTLPGAAAQDSAPTLKELLQAYWDGDGDVVTRRFTRARRRSNRSFRSNLDRERGFGQLAVCDSGAAAGTRRGRGTPAGTFTAYGRSVAGVGPGADHFQGGRPRSPAPTAISRGSGTRRPSRSCRGSVPSRTSGPSRQDRKPSYGRLAAALLAGARDWQDQQAAASTGDRAMSALEEATRFYDRAARDPSARAEGSARAAFAFIRLGRHRDAMRRLDSAGETPDLAVAAWLPLLRSRALAALGEEAEARLNAEAAAAMATSLGTSDPWTLLERGDDRMVAEWLPGLRAALDARTGARSTAARSTAFLVLDQYDRREYEPIVALLVKLPSLAKFSTDYRETAAAWIIEAGPAHVDRRRAVAAVVALEAARARGGVEWTQAQLLLEWACSQLRVGPLPTELERRSMHAASALLEGAAAGPALELHVTHALTRFPVDPALVMARAVAAELRAGPDERAKSRDTCPQEPAVHDRVMPVTDPLVVTVTRLEEAAKQPDTGVRRNSASATRRSGAARPRLRSSISQPRHRPVHGRGPFH